MNVLMFLKVDSQYRCKKNASRRSYICFGFINKAPHGIVVIQGRRMLFVLSVRSMVPLHA